MWRTWPAGRRRWRLRAARQYRGRDRQFARCTLKRSNVQRVDESALPVPTPPASPPAHAGGRCPARRDWSNAPDRQSREELAQLGAERRVVMPGRHAVEAPIERINVQQRLPQPAAQQSSAHRGEGCIQHAEQRALHRAAADALGQLQVAARGFVKRHELGGAVRPQADDLTDVIPLRLLKVLQQRPAARSPPACRRSRSRPATTPKCVRSACRAVVSSNAK